MRGTPSFREGAERTPGRMGRGACPASEQADEAIDALADIGATSALTRLSQDQNFLYRFLAQKRLAVGSEAAR